MKKITKAAVIAVAALALAACGPESDSASEREKVQEKASSFEAFIPESNVELENYNKAQELYDNPTAIQWCTAFPSSNSAPIITLPVAGKLTTSATSYFSPTEAIRAGDTLINVPSRSVDGLFHGDSFYRYGFTPGGQYVDFSNSLELLCTTSLTEFQRENTFVEGVDVDADVNALQQRAEEALESGEADGAVDILGGK